MNLTLQFINNKSTNHSERNNKTKKLWQQQIGLLSVKTKKAEYYVHTN